MSASYSKTKIPRYPTKTGLIYARVSSMQQVGNHSIKTQLNAVRDAFKRLGIKEVATFVEEGQSAKTTNRTEFQNAISFIKHNKDKVDYFAVYKLDRFSRNQEDFHYQRTQLSKYGTQIISATENIEDTKEGRLYGGIFMALAQYDNEAKGERVKHNMLTKALDGWYPTQPPYGYMNDQDTKTIVKDPIYYNIVELIFRDYLSGLTIAEIVTKLQKKKVYKKRTKKKSLFDNKTVHKILTKSKFYTGLYDWADQTNIKGKHPTMITMQQHKDIQDKLSGKPKKLKRNDNDVFVLNFTLERGTGFLHCDNCGKRMSSCKSRGTGGEYFYYYCSNSNCKLDSKSKNKDELESMFVNTLEDVKPTNNYVNLFNEMLVEEWDRQTKDKAILHKQNENRLDELQQIKKDTIAMRRNGELDLEDFNEEISQIKAEILTVTSLLSEELPDKKKVVEITQRSKEVLSNLELIYIDQPVEQKRKMARILFPKGATYADDIFRTNGKSIILEIFDDLESGNLENFKRMTPRRILSNTINLILEFYNLIIHFNIQPAIALQ